MKRSLAVQNVDLTDLYWYVQPFLNIFMFLFALLWQKCITLKMRHWGGVGI